MVLFFAVSDEEFGWGCWSVNFPKSNRAVQNGCNVNVNLHFDIVASRTGFHTVGKDYTVDPLL